MSLPEELPNSPLTRDKLIARGFGRRRIASLVRSGRLRRVLRGIYVRTDVPDTVELRATATALVVAPGHVVVDRTAAWLHGVDVLTYAEHEFLPPVETCALRGNHPTERGGVHGRTRDLAPRDVMTVNGVKVTTPLRTAMDLGCNLRRRDAIAALNMLAREYRLSRWKFEQELPRYRRRRGVIQLRELVPLVDPRIESARESWTLLAIHDAELPLPEPQFWVEVDGIPRFRLDLAYPKSRVCVEYDGFDFHNRTEEQVENDRLRRQWLVSHGWTVIVVRAGDFTGAQLDRWINELRDALTPSYSNRRW